MQKTSFSVLLLTILSCSTNQNKAETNNGDADSRNFPIRPLIIESEDEGWGGDIKLSYTKSLTTDNTVSYEVNSTYKSKEIGFEVSVPKGSGKLTIKRMGLASDNFLHLLADIYKQKTDTASKFVDFITIDCMNMGDYVDSLNKQSDGNYVTTAQYKLFFQGKNEDDYAELFLDVNETNHLIELKEKDEEYRPAIIKLLTRK